MKKLNLFLDSLNDSVKDLIKAQSGDDCTDDYNSQSDFDDELEVFYTECKNKKFTVKQKLKLRSILKKVDISCSFENGFLTDIDCFVDEEKEN